tara:strand:+ start:1550 stop:1843 length:294 start_codon:yes stop_codon:yes gene_type:complete
MYRINYSNEDAYSGDRKEEPSEGNLFDLADEAIIFHGLEKCITGMDQFGYAVYDYLKMLEVFTGDDGMTHEEAEEWISYNVVGVNAGNGFVIHYPNL